MGVKNQNYVDDSFLFILWSFLNLYISEQDKHQQSKKILLYVYFLFFLSPFTYGYISLTKDNKRTDYKGQEKAILVKKN